MSGLMVSLLTAIITVIISYFITVVVKLLVMVLDMFSKPETVKAAKVEVAAAQQADQTEIAAAIAIANSRS